MRASRSAGALIVGGNLSTRPGSAGSTCGSRSGLRRSVRCNSQFELNSLRKLEFGHTAPGGHGLQWEGTIVVGAKGQARQLGVIPGWKIHMVDGVVVNTAEDVWMRLQEAKWQWRSCNVWFVTDFKSIRAEQAEDRARKMKEEEARLARLPFEGTQDSTHLEQVHAEFKFQGGIERAEDRAITVKQLERALKWVDSHCYRWRDACTRQRLTMSSMNMHQINEWLIKPATKDKNCSFLELLTCQKQPPNWFVIHWWGERAIDFMKCLELQISTRQLDEKTRFWIGAYASRPHSLHDDVDCDIRKTCYFRAMAAAKFQALMTLEPKVEIVKDGISHFQGPATCFSRIWCNLEAMMCCYDLPVGADPVLDIAATQGSKAMLLTSGLTADEENLEAVNPGSGYKAKMEREHSFSLDIIEAGLSIKVQHAQSTEPTDRSRVLNCIAGRDLNQAALDKHELYDKASCRIRALIATTCWRRVMAGASGYALQTMVAEALRSDIWDDTLELSMAYCTGVVERMPFVMRSLHSSLLYLTLNFKGMSLDDSVTKELAATLPNRLEELHIDLSQNPEITNAGIANFAASVPPRLKALVMNLKGTHATKDFQDNSDTLEGIRKAIQDEAQRGSLCTTINLSPSPNRRMGFSTKRTQV